jgi:beta-lactam-binding protein with PASTA domain
MRFLLGLLIGYNIRGKKPLLFATLTVIALMVFVVIPGIALSQLALAVHRERLSRPAETTVPSIIGLDYKTAETKLRAANLNIKLLANRYDLAEQPDIIVDQSPKAGERVIYQTQVGVTITKTDPDKHTLLRTSR